MAWICGWLCPEQSRKYSANAPAPERFRTVMSTACLSWAASTADRISGRRELSVTGTEPVPECIPLRARAQAHGSFAFVPGGAGFRLTKYDSPRWGEDESRICAARSYSDRSMACGRASRGESPDATRLIESPDGSQ